MGNLRNLFIIFIAASIALALSWVGFYGFDDWEYSNAARQWLSQDFFLGDTHWELRHPHVLPIVFSYALFGFGEWQLVAPTVIYFFLLLLTIYYFVNQFAGGKAALASCLVIVMTPLAVTTAAMTRPDITEAFFVFLSAFLFWRAAESAAMRRNLFFAGMAAGLGWLTRETSIGLIAVYGLLFLAGHRYERRNYWIMAGGFAAVAALEMLYSAVMSGNPLYRYAVDFSMQTEAMKRLAGVQQILPAGGEAVSSVHGNLSVHWLIDPFLAILINEEFCLLFWIAIPIGAWLCSDRRLPESHRDLARFLSLLALVWFLLISYGMNLREQPRYYMVPATAAAVLIGIWAVHSSGFVSLWRRAGVLTAFAAASLLGFYVDDEDLIYAERAAARYASAYNEPIYTDKKTVFRAQRLFDVQQIPWAVSDIPPPPGALYLYVPENFTDGKNKQHSLDGEKYKPQPGWKELTRDGRGRMLPGIIIEKTGFKEYVPESIYRKLDHPFVTVILYRVPGGKIRKTP